MANAQEGSSMPGSIGRKVTEDLLVFSPSTSPTKLKSEMETNQAAPASSSEQPSLADRVIIPDSLHPSSAMEANNSTLMAAAMPPASATADENLASKTSDGGEYDPSTPPTGPQLLDDSDNLQALGNYLPIAPLQLSTPLASDGATTKIIEDPAQLSTPIISWSPESPPGIPVVDITDPVTAPLYSSPAASTSSLSDHSTSQDLHVPNPELAIPNADVSDLSNPDPSDDAPIVSTQEPISPAIEIVASKVTTIIDTSAINDQLDKAKGQQKDEAAPVLTQDSQEAIVVEDVEQLAIKTSTKPKPAVLQSYLDSLPNEPSHRNLARLARIQRLRTTKVNGTTVTIATVDNWEIVVPPRMFAQGELVLFLEKDSFVPTSEDFITAAGSINDGKLNALWAHCRKETVNGVKGKVVQAYLTSGTISEGLIFPLTTCKKVVELLDATKSYHSHLPDAHAITLRMAMDFRLADWLCISKWNVPTKTKGDNLGANPPFIPSANLTRLAAKASNILTQPKYLTLLYQETIKLDGSTMHAYFVRKDSVHFKVMRPLLSGDNTASMDLPNGRFGVCSNNVELKDEAISAFWNMAHKYDLPKKMNELNKNAVISGELVGATVSGNHEKYPPGQHDFFVFRIHDIDTVKDLKPENTVAWAAKLGLKHVPVRGNVTLRQFGDTLADLEKRAEDTGREGLVYRCIDDGRTLKLLNKKWTWFHKT